MKMDGSLRNMDQTLSITAIVRTKDSADNVRSVSDNFDTNLILQTGEFSQFAPGLRAPCACG